VNAAPFAVGCLLLCGCALQLGGVTRVADGVEFEGRPIDAEAYGTYAEGALFEAQGDDRAALAAYLAALAQDPAAPEILARLGAVRCRLSRQEDDMMARTAEMDFGRALRLDPLSSTAWAEVARCKARYRRDRDAYAAARQAFQADPWSMELALLVAERAEAAGDLPSAGHLLEGWVAEHPDSREAWAALGAFAVRHRNPGASWRAARALQRLRVASTPEETLATALTRNDRAAASSAAESLHVAPSELALTAVQHGALELARAESGLVLGADPDDGNAWVAALVAADLSRDQAAFTALLHAAPVSASPLSPAAIELLSSLLERRLGSEARDAWQAAARDSGHSPTPAREENGATTKNSR
jgi:tetratricopeptide (TPR) repeat protein